MPNHYRALRSPPPQVATDRRQPLSFAASLPGGIMLVVAFALFAFAVAGFAANLLWYLERRDNPAFDQQFVSQTIGAALLITGGFFLASLVCSAFGLYMLRRR